MLFKEIHLSGIKSGKITLAFRRWQKASVKAGSLIYTSIGRVEIGKIEAVSEHDISDKDAQHAGFPDKEQLLKSLNRGGSAGTIFRVAVSYHSADPRIELRGQAALPEQEFADLERKLAKLDRFSKQGDWTRSVLFAIKENPHLHAIGIAKLTGFEKEWLKLNIRKLKNLGLTISHPVGYELSPLGNAYIKMRLAKNHGCFIGT